MGKAMRQRCDQCIEQGRIRWSKILESHETKQPRKDPHGMGYSLRLRPERGLQSRSLTNSQANVVRRLELFLKKRKKRRVNWSNLPRSELSPDGIRRVTRMEKRNIGTTRRKKQGQVSIRKGHADPLEPGQEDRSRSRGAKEIFEKSTRRSRRSNHILRKEINKEGEHAPKLRPHRLLNRRVHIARQSVWSRILRSTEGRGRKKRRRSGRRRRRRIPINHRRRSGR